MSKLDAIVKQRRVDVQNSKDKGHEEYVSQLKARADKIEKELGPPLNLFQAIKDHGGSSSEMFVAAEFKRASPSKGDMIGDGCKDCGRQAASYAGAGAGLISVLTEPKWFKGSLDDLESARRAINVLVSPTTGTRPLVLRKDFIVDDLQILEARASGADSLLLMLSVLTEAECGTLLIKSRELGMEPLVEVVNKEEMDAALRIGAKVIGVNNRNLHTFVVDMQTTPRMVTVARHAGVINDVAILALSGTKTRGDVRAYELHGDIAGILVGEALMRAPDPAAMISNLVRDNQGPDAGNQVTRVKVCGINDSESALVAAKAGADMIGVIFVTKSVRHATLDQAKQITAAIRSFREMEAKPIIPAVPLTGGTAEHAEQPATKRVKNAPKSWFSAWSDNLGQLCDGQARPLVVGVFMNQPVSEVNRIALEAGVDIIQLHGKEDAAYEAQCVLPVMRVAHVDSQAKSDTASCPVKPEDLKQGPAALLLLDTSIKGGASGGTGVTFDWKIANNLRESQNIPVVMAGGLNPDNVAEAVKAARPWGVDVASGVESAPGKKDHDKIKSFVSNAKRAV